MSEEFDPYHEWLGIPASEQPPHHYRLLGIQLFEENPTVIENAADQRMAHLRNFQAGKHTAESQRLLNEVAQAKVCLLNREKKTAYDQLLQRKAYPAILATARPAPGLSEAGLAEIFETPLASTSAIISRRRGKKSQPKSTALVVAVALALVAIGFAVWVTIGHDRPPSEAETAKVENPISVATPRKEAVMKSPGAAKKEMAVPAAAVSKQDSRADLSKAAPVSKLPEREVVAEAKPIPIVDTAEEAKPASQDTAAEKPSPNKSQAPAKRLVPPSADEQKRLMGEIDEIYKPGGGQRIKAALARKLLEDGAERGQPGRAVRTACAAPGRSRATRARRT